MSEGTVSDREMLIEALGGLRVVSDLLLASAHGQAFHTAGDLAKRLHGHLKAAGVTSE